MDARQLYRALLEVKPQLVERINRGERNHRRLSALHRALETLTCDQATRALAAHPWPGARPTAELEAGAKGFIIPFEREWAFRPEARAWADAQLARYPVAGVDGSHFEAERGMSLSIGAVQIGYHYHDPRVGKHGEEREFALILPEASPALADERENLDQNLNSQVTRERFVRECRRLGALMEDLGHPTIGFLDNTFTLSYVQYLPAEQSGIYLREMETLLQASQRLRTPLVGYVDTSYSRDLIHMMEKIVPDLNTDRITDAGLLHELLPRWGDRTPFFQCARQDGVSQGQNPDSFYYRDVGFVYMRTDPLAHPSRIEIPLWVYEQGHLEAVLDVVRAQLVYGDFHYPFILARADRTAVLTRSDRTHFYRYLQKFAHAELGLTVHRAAKANSKRATRIRR